MFNYDIGYTDNNTWYLVHNVSREEIKKSGIPRFAQVRKGTKDVNNVMKCTCCYKKNFMIHFCHILCINQRFFDKNDVCVRNTIEYLLKYGDVRFQELTAKFDREMESYQGPKYHVKNDKATEYPVFLVSDQRNKSMIF